MKFSCGCGAMISDSTDCLPNKGYLLPDQDYFLVLERLESLLEQAAQPGKPAVDLYLEMRRALPPMRNIYQCSRCGRIFIWDSTIQGAYSFLPEDADTPSTLMATQREKPH